MQGYKYSLPIWEVPWIVLRLTQNEYDNSSLDIKSRCFDIEQQNISVVAALTREDISTLMLDVNREQDIESWAEDEPKGKYFNRTIKGKQIKIAEHMAYFCFTGAEIIAQLFTSRDPYQFNIKCETSMKYRKEVMSLDNIQNLYGVFLFEINHRYEGHAFVVWIRDNLITIYNTYGGNVGIFIVTYNRIQWINFFVNFSSMLPELQKDNYHLLFGFRKDMTDWIDKQILETGVRIIDLKCCRLL